MIDIRIDLPLVNQFCRNYLLRDRLNLNSSVGKLLSLKLNLMRLLPGMIKDNLQGPIFVNNTYNFVKKYFCEKVFHFL